MSNKFVAAAALIAVITTVIAISASFAYAPEGDLMKIKGYSPDLINTINTQRSRQEWREPPAPRRGPLENAFHNIFWNDWTGSFDEFGSEIIRSY